MGSFLITGLPRSKTAWMSVVASTIPGSLCRHEPMAHMKSWECCFDIWKNTAYEHRGVSDAHLGFHLGRIIAEANPQILIIRRDIAQVKESLTRIGGAQSNYCDLLAVALDKFSGHPAIASVGFDSLKSPAIVQQCLQHLMPGCVPDESRIRELIDLNIQADLDLVWQRALESRADVNKILGIDQIPGINVYQ